jgi:ParB-like chromosome segregation protein Spo0J
MNEAITTIPLDKLVPHPDNPNHMSKVTFAKLVRNIEQTGLYEPLIVRPAPNQEGFFQIINGHHRCQALRQLGRETAHAVVWEIDDQQTDILLTTLNRLGGRDMLDKKLALLRRMTQRTAARDLARLLPHTATQIQRLTATAPMRRSAKAGAGAFAIPIVFYVNVEQQQIIEEALARVETGDAKNRSAKRSQALAHIAASFVNRHEGDEDE